MANSNAELEAFMSAHNETLKARAHHVAPPIKEYKQLILEQLMKEISRAWETVNERSTFIWDYWEVIRERQKYFLWINHNMVEYFIKVSKAKQQNNYQQLPAASITMVDDVKAMVSLFKHPGDSKMPSTKAKLIK